MVKIIALASLVVVLGLVNWSIAGKEDHITNGKTVFLDLAPRDPRSLMQGDYMALRFQMGRDIHTALPKSETYSHRLDASDGYVIVSLDENNIATYKALYADQALAENEILMRYRVRNDAVKFATNAFFFQEGHADYYQSARYGQFKVDKTGDLLLVAMYDKDLKKLQPPAES